MYFRNTLSGILFLTLTSNVFAVGEVQLDKELIIPEQYLQEAPEIVQDDWFYNPQIEIDAIDFDIAEKGPPTTNSDVRLYLFKGRFQSRYDLYVSGSYGNIKTDSKVSDPAGQISTSINSDTGTFQIGKLIFPRLLLGSSFSYSSSNGTITTPTTAINIESDSWTIAPHLSAFYIKGSWVFSTTPTYILQLSKNKFSGGIADEDADLSSLVFYNSIAYHAKKWRLKAIFDYNRILKNNLNPAVARQTDNNWFTLGMRFDLNLTTHLNIHADIERYVANSTTDLDIINLGLSYRF